MVARPDAPTACQGCRHALRDPQRPCVVQRFPESAWFEVLTPRQRLIARQAAHHAHLTLIRRCTTCAVFAARAERVTADARRQALDRAAADRLDRIAPAPFDLEDDE